MLATICIILLTASFLTARGLFLYFEGKPVKASLGERPSRAT